MFNIICGCTRGSPFIYKRIEEFALERIKGIALGQQKCRKPVFMRVSGICFIEWLWFGSICGESNGVISFEKVNKKEEGTSYVANKRRSTEVNS